ncbi:MAG: heme exporter protein CcmB [Alphaproteobacteria bacterium]
MPVWSLLAFEIRQSLQRGQEALLVLTFFAVAYGILPLTLSAVGGVPPAVENLYEWAIALFAMLLATDGLILRDVQDGTLDRYKSLGASMALLLASRTIACWALSGLPIVVIVWLTSLQKDYVAFLALSFAVGTLAICFLSVLVQCLLVQAKASQILTGLVLFPLCIPAIVFGCGVATALEGGYACVSSVLQLAHLLFVIPLSLGLGSYSLSHLSQRV